MKRTYKEIERSFPEAQVSMLNDSIKLIFPNNLMFQKGSSTIAEQFSSRLKRFSMILNKFNRTDLLISGHTDNSGNTSTNLELSLNRSNNVKDKLINNNVSESRLYTEGQGERSPIVSNETEEERKINRRVEFIVLFKRE